MISLKKEGTAIILPPGQSVRIEDRNDVLNFDTIDPVISWPFNLPTEPNAQVFGFPDRIDSTVKTLREYDAEVLLNENPWKTGILKIQKADKDTITANFRGRAGVLSQYKETMISELVNATIPTGTRDASVEIPLYNTSPNSPAVFPVFNHATTSDNIVLSRFVGDKAAGIFNHPNEYGWFVPFFRVNYIIKSICQYLGYEYHEYLSNRGSGFENWVISGNIGFYTSPSTDMPVNINVSEYLPDITLGDLFKSVGALVGGRFAIKPEAGIIRLSSFNSIISDPLFVDFSDQVTGKITSEKVEKVTYSPLFGISNDDLINTDQPAGNYLGSVANVASLPSIASVEVGDYQFCELENMYYRSVYDAIENEEYWLEYLSPFQPKKTEGDTKLVESKIIPVQKKDHYTFPKQSNIKFEDNGSGKIRLLLARSPSSTIADIRAIQLTGFSLDSNNADVYSEQKEVGVLAFASVSTHPAWMDVDVDIAGATDIGSCSVTIKWNDNKFIPHITGKERIYYINNGVDARTTEPRLSIFHGMQPDQADVNYAYASSDNIDSKGNLLTGISIRFVLGTNLNSFYWDYINYFTSITRRITGQFSLDIQQLQAFDVFTKCRINGVDLIIRLLKSIHTTDGLQKQDFEGYKVPE
jgi:hypothetical protein